MYNKQRQNIKNSANLKFLCTVKLILYIADQQFGEF